MEYSKEKICPNCGEKLPNDAVFCSKCGTKTDAEAENIETYTATPGFWERNKKKILTLVIAISAVLIIFFVFHTVQTSKLKKELMRGWSRLEGDSGSYIDCILDFSDDEIEYRLETGYSWMDTTVATYDYKVISGNKIKVLRYGDEWEKNTPSDFRQPLSPLRVPLESPKRQATVLFSYRPR